MDPLITYPARAGTGLRHVVLAGSPRTLCGTDCDNWFLETKRFDALTIGCKRCKAIFRARVSPRPT